MTVEATCPSTLEDYFHKAREIFVAKERIAELDSPSNDLSFDISTNAMNNTKLHGARLSTALTQSGDSQGYKTSSDT